MARRRPPAPYPALMSGQLPLFTLEDDVPLVVDVEGLLLAGGALVRRDAAARISVVVDVGWRAEVVCDGLDRRGLGGELGTPDNGRCSVRSGFDVRLLDLARRWTVGASFRVPTDFVLTPGRLRFWAVATGQRDQVGYLLRLGSTDEQLWDAAGSALSAAGVPGAFLGSRAGGPAYRIVGRRRLARLREMLGRPPIDDAAGDWPGRPDA